MYVYIYNFRNVYEKNERGFHFWNGRRHEGGTAMLYSNSVLKGYFTFVVADNNTPIISFSRQAKTGSKNKLYDAQ